MGILSKLKKGNNEEATLNDLKDIEGTRQKLEKKLIQQKKEKEKQLYRIKCEKCKTEIQLDTTKIQSVVCSNKACLSKYKVKVTYPYVPLPKDTDRGRSLASKEWREGTPIDESEVYKVRKPIFEVNHIGYAYETDRINYPASDLTIDQIMLRCDKAKNIDKNLDLAFDDLTDAFWKLLKAVRSLYKKGKG